MILIFSLILLDAILLIYLVISTTATVKLDLSTILYLLGCSPHFQTYSVFFIFLFIAVPLAIMTIILVSFKLYTHDFIKPIQRSYIFGMLCCLSSIIFNLAFVEFIYKLNISFYVDKFVLINLRKEKKGIIAGYYNSFDYETLNQNDFIYAITTLTKISTLLLNTIIFIGLFLLSEIQIAFKLNSIPMSNLHLLKKNNKGLIAVLFTTFVYSILTMKYMLTVYKLTESYFLLSVILGISYISALLTNLLFYYAYLQSVNFYVISRSRIYRNFISP